MVQSVACFKRLSYLGSISKRLFSVGSVLKGLFGVGLWSVLELLFFVASRIFLKRLSGVVSGFVQKRFGPLSVQKRLSGTGLRLVENRLFGVR